MFAECLTAWLRGDEDVDARAGAFVFAEKLIRIEQALVGDKK